MPALVPAVIGPQTILLHVQQLHLNPVARPKLLVARKFVVQLRNQANQQVLQLRQNVVALGNVIFLKKFRRCAGLVPV
jgi:hypothetical protein